MFTGQVSSKTCFWGLFIGLLCCMAGISIVISILLIKKGYFFFSPWTLSFAMAFVSLLILSIIITNFHRKAQDYEALLKDKVLLKKWLQCKDSDLLKSTSILIGDGWGKISLDLKTLLDPAHIRTDLQKQLKLAEDEILNYRTTHYKFMQTYQRLAPKNA